jgi:cytochrome c5
MIWRTLAIVAGNAAARCAERAGLVFSFSLTKRPRVKMVASAVLQHRPEIFRATCRDCGDGFAFNGDEGATVLNYFCLTCQGRRWSVAPDEHQQSRKV